MSIRKKILARAIFNVGGEVNGIKFGPLSTPRIETLIERGNPLFDGSKSQRSIENQMAEVLFVLSRTKEERPGLVRIDAEEWALRVREFHEGLEDDTLLTFWQKYWEPAIEEIRMAKTESVGVGKPATRSTPATSRSSSKARKGSASGRSPKR